MMKKWLTLPRKNISIVQFIIEGYDGLATVTTIDARRAVILVSIMPDYVEEAASILENIKMKYGIEDIVKSVADCRGKPMITPLI